MRSSHRGFLLLLPALLGACGLVSLEELRVTPFPGDRNQVISAADTVSLRFSIPPDRPSAEGLLKVSSESGAVSGDLAWDGDRLVFTPVPPLPVGVRMLLSFSGTLIAADGRRFAVGIEVPFFVGSDSLPPRLVSFQPAEGGTAGTASVIQLTFSEAMDAESFRQGFSLSPGTEFDLTWSPDGRTVTISPREKWTTLSLYTWQVRETVKASSGARLTVSRSGSFLVQEDHAPPALVSIRQAVLQAGAFLFPGGALADLQARDCIYLTFSEAVTPATLQEAFFLDPAVNGHFVQAGPEEFAFVPDADYRMGQTYHLRVSTDLEDLAANRMASDRDEWFTPLITPILVQSITPLAQSTITVFDTPNPAPVTPDAAGELTLTIQFNRVFDQESRAAVPLLITCQGYFPDSLLTPALRSAAWPSGSTLEVTFAGFAPPAPPAEHFYLLTIPGGENGIRNADGSFLEERVWVLLVE